MDDLQIMPRSPDLEFHHFSIVDMKDRFDRGQILINEEYQRSFIWKRYQRKNLIESIMKGLSIGVLVTWENRNRQLEILDGQQRIRTIITYLKGDFPNNANKKFRELTRTEQSEIEGYSVYYIQLKSALEEEQISDIFTRLQEGTPLNTPEKVNAFRGKFREHFMLSFKVHRLFEKVQNYRFRARFLAAQFLLLELKTDFDRNSFPGMSYLDFKNVNEEFKEEVPSKKFAMCNTYTNFLGTFLFNEIGAIPYRDWISLYLLASYLHKKVANKEGLGIYFRQFTLEFMRNLTSFSIYDTSPPRGMAIRKFRKFMNYKQFGRQATLMDSIEKRFRIILSEYKLFQPIKYKDSVRLFNEEQKIRVYFKQRGLCSFCKKTLRFEEAKAHHKYEHARGGPTKIENLQLVHLRCHDKIHRGTNG
jgi:hypothetical protein